MYSLDRYATEKGDIYRLLNGVDSFGNVCGRKNDDGPTVLSLNQHIDMSDYPHLYYTDPADSSAPAVCVSALASLLHPPNERLSHGLKPCIFLACVQLPSHPEYMLLHHTSDTQLHRSCSPLLLPCISNLWPGEIMSVLRRGPVQHHGHHLAVQWLH